MVRTVRAPQAVRVARAGRAPAARRHSRVAGPMRATAYGDAGCVRSRPCSIWSSVPRAPDSRGQRTAAGGEQAARRGLGQLARSGRCRRRRNATRASGPTGERSICRCPGAGIVQHRAEWARGSATRRGWRDARRPAMEKVDEFLVAERTYCDDESKLSVGLANIHAEVPDVEANRTRSCAPRRSSRSAGEHGRVPRVLPVGLLLGRARGLPGVPEEAVTEANTGLDRVRAGAAAGRRPGEDPAEQPDRVQGRGPVPEPHVRGGRRRRLPGRRPDLRQGLPAGHREGLHRQRPRRPPGHEDPPRQAGLHHVLRLPVQRAAARVRDGRGGGRRRADGVVARLRAAGTTRA